MINIIGGGPAGCFAGHLLAKQGYKVNIYEEHRKIGVPVRCSGIVTEDINNIIKLKKELIKNTISNIKVISSDKHLNLESKEIILDRERFDNYLKDLAVDSGCTLNLNSRFISKDKVRCENKIISLKKDSQIIGADGPFSRVAASYGLIDKKQFLTGIQIKTELNVDPNTLSVYLGKNQGFSWIVPESENICMIGTMTQSKESKKYFDEFKKSLKIKKQLSSQSGLIPIFNPKQILQKDNVYLLGDAACQVKASTGGGIIPSLKAAQLLCKSISTDTNYDALCKKELNNSLRMHLIIRNILDKFTLEDYTSLIDMLNKPGIAEIFKKYSRDRPYSLVPRLLLKQPLLLKYFKCLI